MNKERTNEPEEEEEDVETHLTWDGHGHGHGERGRSSAAERDLAQWRKVRIAYRERLSPRERHRPLSFC